MKINAFYLFGIYILKWRNFQLSYFIIQLGSFQSNEDYLYIFDMNLLFKVLLLLFLFDIK